MKVTITHLKDSPRPWPYHSPGAQIRLNPGESGEVTDTYAAEYRRPDAQTWGEWLVAEANKGQDKPHLRLDILTDEEDAAASDVSPPVKPPRKGKEQK